MLMLRHLLKYKDSHVKIHKLLQSYLKQICNASVEAWLLWHLPSQSYSFDLSGPCWTSQQASLVTMLAVHTFDPQWKVPVTLYDPITDLKFLELNWSHQLFGFHWIIVCLSHIMAGISEQTDTHKSPLCCYQCDIINQPIVLGISCTLPLPVTRQVKIKRCLGLVYTLNHCQVIVWDYKRAVYFSSSRLPISLLWFRFCDV